MTAPGTRSAVPAASTEPTTPSGPRIDLPSPRAWRELWETRHAPCAFLDDLRRRIVRDDVVTVAGALAFYFFLALFPLVIFVLSLISVLPVEGFSTWLVQAIRESLPPEVAGAVASNLQKVFKTPRRGLLSFGAVLALWTASAGFQAVTRTMNRAYRVRDERPWWRARLAAIVLTLAVAVLLVLAFLLAPFGGMLTDVAARALGPFAGTATSVGRWALLVATMTLLVAAIYYAAPAVERQWQWVRPGAVLFTLGFLATSVAFSAYLSRFHTFDRTYGSLGTVIALLVWLYVVGFLLLAGAELNALLEERAGASAARPGRDRSDSSRSGPDPGFHQRGEEGARAASSHTSP